MLAPFIGSNGNWWIDNRDTGIPASGKSPIIGENGNWWIFDPALNEYADTGATAYGKTAYEYAVDYGYTGTEEDFGKMLNEVPNAVKDAKGYQLQYALNKKFKKKKSIQTKKTKYTIKKLKKKKTYYIRVRAYKMNGKKKVYGKWSTVKKVKIRK